MKFSLGGTTHELVVAQYPSHTHLAQSSTPGGRSPLALNAENKLDTHAVLGNGTVPAAVLLCGGVLIGAVARRAAPHIKKGLVNLKARLSRPAGSTDNEAAVQLTIVADDEPKSSGIPRLAEV